MKLTKRSLGMLLALMMIVSIPAAALADTYDIANGSIDIYADAEGQTVAQYGEQIVEKQDPAPVITGSSDEHHIEVDNYGGTANVTLNGVTADYFDIYDYASSGAQGQTTVTLQGENNTSEWCDWNGSVTVEGDGTLNINNDGYTALELYGDVTVDGATINATGAVVGIGIYEGSLTVESGTVTGTATGLDPADAEGAPDDKLVSAGIGVTHGSTLAVNGGTVTGINENQGLDGMHPGIGFEDGAKLTVGAGVTVYDADGKDVTAAAVADPTVLNTSAKTTISAPEEADAPVRAIVDSDRMNIESTVKNAAGEVVDAKVIVKFFDNHNFLISIISNYASEDMYGRFSLQDGKLVFSFRGVDYELNADNVLVLPMRNGGSVEVKFPADAVDILLASF